MCVCVCVCVCVLVRCLYFWDVLAITASTVASESAFSTGSRIISDYRSSLSSKTVEALVCLQDWFRTAGILLYILFLHLDLNSVMFCTIFYINEG